MHSQTGEICCFTVLGLIDPALCTYVFDILDFSAKMYNIYSISYMQCHKVEMRKL